MTDEAVESPERSGPPPADIHLVFEQYKLAVEMVDSISSRRQASSSFFIGLLSTFGVLYTLLEKAPPSVERVAWEFTLPVMGVVVSAVWWLTISSYRSLNAAKWEVIVEMESKLPASPFATEWGKLKSGKKHVALTTLEGAVPIITGTVFLVLLFIGTFGK